MISIAAPDRVNESEYRECCVERLAEIVIDISSSTEHGSFCQTLAKSQAESAIGLVPSLT